MHLWVFSNLKNDDFPHVLKVYMEQIVSFFVGGRVQLLTPVVNW